MILSLRDEKITLKLILYTVLLIFIYFVCQENREVNLMMLGLRGKRHSSNFTNSITTT